MKSKNGVISQTTSGFLYGIGAYTLWGFLPLYWKMLDSIPAIEILAHRILWSFVFLATIMLFRGNFNTFKEVFKEGGNVVRIACATIFITLNWGMYIWAINSGHVVEASMGYYINPLIVILLSVVVLKERLSHWQTISILMAAIGVAIITLSYGQVPWISLILALTFALYGLMKKKIPLPSTISLGIETAMLMPLVIGYITYRQVNGIGALGSLSLSTTLILVGSGIATALPLLWFGEGTRRIPLSSMGFLQYIAPTISLTLGIFVFKEQFTRIHLLSFGCIWTGLLIYSISQIIQLRNLQNNPVKSTR